MLWWLYKNWIGNESIIEETVEYVWRVEAKEKQTSYFALEDEHRQLLKESFS